MDEFFVLSRFDGLLLVLLETMGLGKVTVVRVDGMLEALRKVPAATRW